ncbi:hypothetical protein SERLADRAFT_373963 [Serpula lacrymans var. lacrymans S7.9]|uniref:Secreted protein n=1 Tax=Serpula lacrymans var. lacrymans (strain S7.9) TaxID=578457 RepID=F8PAR4_SERL9|nr:uncharacterized protein SERLADRAFT_373963 [Serpula lacrymans var. lacrymans S7.9]EGO19902.1 hypothetical protein SERLADRAFT_373963 [Serpula lacrymans var. lacrymans S7.9]
MFGLAILSVYIFLLPFPLSATVSTPPVACNWPFFSPSPEQTTCDYVHFASRLIDFWFVDFTTD